MAFLVYEDWADRSRVRVPKEPISQWDTKRVMAAWAKHVENRAFLEFMARRGTFEERAQARRELEVCARKLAFWEKHPEWRRGLAVREVCRVRAAWAGQEPDGGAARAKLEETHEAREEAKAGYLEENRARAAARAARGP